MIKGIQGFNETQGQILGEGGYGLPAGNYYCKILKAEGVESKNGRPMLAIYFDIATGEHKDYYQNQHERAKKYNQNAKYRGVLNQLMDGTSLPYYKGLLEVFSSIIKQEINGEQGYDPNILKGLIFGGRFGEEEYYKDGDIKKTVKLRYIVHPDNIETYDILPIKKLNPEEIAKFDYTVSPVEDDDELPF